VARLSTPPPTPAPNPDAGAWTQQGGNWVWVPGGTPDPSLASQWGASSLSNPTVDPSGAPGHGAWVQSGQIGRSGQPLWNWQWGGTPNPSQASQFGAGNLINPAWNPPGNAGITIPNDPSPASPTAPDVVPPTVGDVWGGVAPDVTGNVPPADGSSQTVSRPPSHNPYMVSPGGIRNAENVLLGETDSNIAAYNTLKNAVAQSASQNLATDPATTASLASTQDSMLQQIGDALQLTGQFTNMLNSAAQNYAHADIGSFLPQS
jgi:hypothetical protein